MKNKLFKKGLAGLLSVVMALGLVTGISVKPVKVQAAETAPEPRSMNLNVKQGDGSYSIAGITDPTEPINTTDAWSGSKVYYGRYRDTPLLFRVLDADTTDYNSTTHTMFLDCDKVLAKVKFDGTSNVWNGSTLKTWMNKDAISGFTQAEKDAIAASTRSEMTVEDLSNWTSNYLSWCSLNEDEVFALDAREASNPAYGYSTTDDAANKVKQELSGSEGVSWWLRSAYISKENFAGIADSDGKIDYTYVGGTNMGGVPLLT